MNEHIEERCMSLRDESLHIGCRIRSCLEKVGEVGMIKLIFDDWCWRCENCKSMMALPGIVPSLEMLKEKGWKYCPVCGKKIDFKATEANKPDWIK